MRGGEDFLNQIVVGAPFFLFSLWTSAVGHGGEPIPGGGHFHQPPLCMGWFLVAGVFFLNLFMLSYIVSSVVK